MAIRDNRNFLDFTKLTYSEIIEQVTNKLNQDPRFENFRESAIAQMMVEMFSGVADLNNYYIERKGEEVAGFETARLRSSIISLAKQLGYVVERPIPAESTLAVTLKGPLPAGIVAGDQLSLPQYSTTFTFENNPYILKKAYTYEFTQDDIDLLSRPNAKKVITGSYVPSSDLSGEEYIPNSQVLPIEVIQGKLVTTSFVSTGELLETYPIENSEKFSNLYGDADYSYDPQTGEYDLDVGVTKVTVDASDPWYQDRRSLLTSELLLDNEAEAQDLVLIRTRIDDTVELVFGDDKFATRPTTGQVINLQYLETEGANANKVGVIGKKVNSGNTIIVNTINITNNVEFSLNSNIKNGADIEDVESIKLNAPSLFYSLDRLVSKSDYNTYLRSLTTPYKLKNTVVWGEHDEVQSRADGVGAIKELCNIVLWSALGSMYYKPVNGTYAPKVYGRTDEQGLESILIEGSNYYNDDAPNGIPVSNPEGYGWLQDVYTNLYIERGENGVLDQLDKQENLDPQHNFTVINDQLIKRQQMTVRTIYVSPIIQEFTLTGSIIINRLSSLADVQKKVNNAIYEYLDLNADFNKPLYKSSITEIIEAFPEVENSTIGFAPRVSNDALFPTVTDNDYETQTSPTTITSSQWSTFISTELGYPNPSSSYGAKLANNDDFVSNVEENEGYDIFEQSIRKGSGSTQEQNDYKKIYMTERDFYYTLMRTNYLAASSPSEVSFVNSSAFNELVFRYNNEYKSMFRSSMIDEKGNITNFSLPTEIPLVTIGVAYDYKGL